MAGVGRRPISGSTPRFAGACRIRRRRKGSTRRESGRRARRHRAAGDADNNSPTTTGASDPTATAASAANTPANPNATPPTEELVVQLTITVTRIRKEPLFTLAVGRAPESGRDLCSQPTMSRLENAPS